MTILLRAPAASLAVLLLAAAAAHAAEMEATSRVDRVTVYPDAADVTRVATMDLPEGTTTLLFRNLPASLDPATLRVSGAATGALTIGAVETRASAGRPSGEQARRIKTLEQERDGIAAQLEGLEAKKTMIQRFAASSPAELGGKDRPLDRAQWAAVWDEIGVGVARANDEMRPLRVRVEEIERELDALQAATTRRNGQPLRDVLVTLEAGAALKGDITLSYRAGGAQWRPVYEARLDTKASTARPAIELVSRAEITQRTGEDWTEAEIAVATSRAARQATAPELHPERVFFFEPPPPMPPVPMPMPMSAPPQAAVSAEMKRAAPALMADSLPAAEAAASLETGTFQSVFRLPGRLTVPGDGSTKALRIAARALPGEVLHVTAPALSETAYLEARVKNEAEAPLLPGTVNVFRDGALAGRATLRLVAPGGAFTLGFGTDDSVRVTRSPVERKENEPGLFGSNKQETREYRTSVKNGHAFPIKVSVVDRVPFSENGAIAVETLPRTTPPTEKQVGDKRGVMSWTLDLAPGEQKDVTLAWRVKWPADKPIRYQNAPLPPR